jgi:hypothetical protein
LETTFSVCSTIKFFCSITITYLLLAEGFNTNISLKITHLATNYFDFESI